MRKLRSFVIFVELFVLLLACLPFVVSQQDATCDSENPCKVGCCSKEGSCGFGPDWCGEGNCISNCNAVAECGRYNSNKECPLSVCCSRWGFCGTTEEFCAETSDEETSCQSNCGQPDRMQCSTGSWKQRRIAYYETWADTRSCDSFRPENIPVKALTHINIAFAGIKDSRVAIENSEMIARVAKLKRRNRSLKVWIAVGGWSFSDPGPTRTAWSDMASTKETRGKFINSLMDLFETFDLDGVDLDWEYPVADDRGGKDDDYANYVHLIKEMRKEFRERNPSWGISMAIPASYWYLQNFDIAALEPLVDWFNLMSYDIHGKWDQYNEWTGPYVLGHTNVTEIESGVDLLRRNGINLWKISLGMGFYGRTFTLDDPKCNEPGCVFSDAGLRGECSGESGILTFKEIMARQHRLNDKIIRYDNQTGVKYMVYDETQWITYDDAESFAKKREMLDKGCFGGVMIWAIDQDTPDFQALSGLLGDEFVADGLLEGGELSDKEKEALVDELGGLTGDGCYVTRGCANAKPTIEASGDCNPGDVTVALVHAPGESYINLYGLLSHTAMPCGLGQWKRVCCPAKSPARNCKSEGVPEEGSKKCTGGKGDETCGTGRYELVTDLYVDAPGMTKCSSGSISVCCDAAPELQKCRWTPCTVFHKCSAGEHQPLTTRGDNCETGSFQNFCCPLNGKYSNCQWRPEIKAAYEEDGKIMIPFPTMQECSSTHCPSTQLTIAKARLPQRAGGDVGPCNYYYPGIQHRLCCDPDPNLDLPFDLKKIFANPIGEDVVYSYLDNYGNNDRDPNDPDETDVGDDPYGFIVLDGDEDALQGQFPSNFLFVHENDGTGNPIKKRETLTRDDPDLMTWVFEHEESQHLVYCRKGREGKCEKVFQGGAPDTIIGLPAHIGSGPYARIVSLEPVETAQLPNHHKEKRSMEGHDSTVYRLTIDYKFEAIRRADSTVNLRVDYTNLIPYWDEMTGAESDAGSKVKRSRHEKRWWGGFSEWIERLNTVRKSDDGKLPLSIHKRMLLYRRRAQCARNNVVLKAGIDITLDAKFDMNARWAYYAQGTIVPLNIDTVYAYFELEPKAQAVIEIEGSAEMEYKSPRIKIIDTLSYPGLAIKGIAAVGPTLDMYGSMEAGAKVAGKLKAGAKITFPKYEMYFPQNADSEKLEKFLPPSSDKEERAGGTEMVPILDASVEANVHIDFKITPEANLGIKVNAPMVKGGPVLDAQIVGFVNNTLRFEVEAKASGGVDNPPAASYGIYIKYFYNFGYGGRAVFKWLGSYALKPRTLWDGLGRQKILYEHHGSTARSKRNPLVSDHDNEDKFIPIYNTTVPMDDGWYGSASISPHNSLQKRTTPEDVASFGALKSFFTCNDGGQCSSGECAGDACEWKPGQSPPKSKRADDDDDADDPMDVDPKQTCVNAVPAMMYNCKYFPDESVAGKQINGICRNIMQYFDTSGLGSGPFHATFNIVGGGDIDTNRQVACGDRSTHDFKLTDAANVEKDVRDTWARRCVLESNVLSDLQNKPHGIPGNNNWLSCDEFPFNTMMEGGTPSTARSCVAGYQQELQGNVNRLPRLVEQEVSWTDAGGKTKTDWKSWGANWIDSRAKGRRTDPDLNTAWNHDERQKKSFTFHLFNSDSGTSPTGSSYEVFNHELKSGGDETDMANVLGAINTFDNEKYKIGSYNAWCKRTDHASGPYRSHRFWGNADGRFVRIKGCKIIFDNKAATTKMKRGEKPSSEELFRVKSVEIVEDAPEFDIELPNGILDSDASTGPEKAHSAHAAHVHRHMVKHRVHS
ncbi:hypothetical protein AJ80_01182 [Polytolypa hystricis UAMH7299]|uniref:chitinase n=1 Tax=Polytolypa hystricis (strain UAMH7299) TaxID=1447883 RepID=A0A2B7Z0V5_POLH7|nr:hypothetical protein AJ80_01182 [Polytolypa hystricis UAMH7299]